MANPGPMNDYTRRKLRAAAGFLILAFLVLEGAVRLIGISDADGNRWFRGVRLRPYRLPVQRTAKLLRDYAAAPARALSYDPDIGWVPEPGHAGKNSQGFTSSLPEVALKAPAGRLRIAIFGPSYADGSFETGWWRTLEGDLQKAGVDAEVLNFACGGYGMDQALLRWRKQGAQYHPHIVLFGFTRENAEANLHLLRLLEDPGSGTPFMKPRFLLEHGQLRLINAPTPTPEEVPGLIAHFSGWALAANELNFSPSDYRSFGWRHSALLSFCEARIAATRQRDRTALLYQSDGEAAQLALKIITQFKTEVENAGSRFCVANLPTEADLRFVQANGSKPFGDLAAAVQRIAPFIETEPALLAAAQGRDLARYFSDGHYTNELRPAVGHAIAAALLPRPEVAPFRRPR